MVTENVNLPERQAEFIRRIIESGRFGNVSEVVRAGVSLLEQRMDQERALEDKLRAMLEEAKASGISDRTPQEIWDAVEASYTHAKTG